MSEEMKNENENKNQYLWILPVLVFPLVLWSCYTILDLYRQSDISTAGFAGLFMILISYGLLFFCAIPFNKRTDKNIPAKRVYYSLLLIPTFLFYIVIAGMSCKSTLCLLNPFNFLPALVVFWFLIKGTKHKKTYVLLFFAFPMLIIANDYLQTWYFLATCEAKTPKAEYNPIYLPDEFFHEEIIDGETKLVPNIRDSTEINNFNNIESNKFSSGYIYIYWVCSVFENRKPSKPESIDKLSMTTRGLIKNNNIILCKDYRNGNNVYEQVLSMKKRKTLAKLYSIKKHTGFERFPGTWVYCKYSKNDKNEPGNLKKSDLNYINYIKPLSEETINQGE